MVGGTAALFGAVAYLGAAVLRDLGVAVNPIDAAERVAQLGAAFGLAAWIYGLVGLN